MIVLYEIVFIKTDPHEKGRQIGEPTPSDFFSHVGIGGATVGIAYSWRRLNGAF